MTTERNGRPGEGQPLIADAVRAAKGNPESFPWLHSNPPVRQSQTSPDDPLSHARAVPASCRKADTLMFSRGRPVHLTLDQRVPYRAQGSRAGHGRPDPLRGRTVPSTFEMVSGESQGSYSRDSLRVRMSVVSSMEHTIDEQRRTYQNVELLRAFWERAGKARSRGGRLMLLRQMAEVELAPDPYVEHSTPGARRHFERRKHRGAFRLQGWCWVCEGETPDDRHHIIPLAAGGRNRKLNVVNLCKECHKDVHKKRWEWQ